jgi:hypothetical protein
MMTSLIVRYQSKERTLVLLHREAIFNQSAARSPVQDVASSEFSPSKKYLREDLILPELLSENLSDAPRSYDWRDSLR